MTLTKIEAYRWLQAVGRCWDEAEERKDFDAEVFFLFWYRGLKKFLGIPMGYTGPWPMKKSDAKAI